MIYKGKSNYLDISDNKWEDIMTAAVNEKLTQFLREGQNWEKKPTNM
jgi:hypothetical protein